MTIWYRVQKHSHIQITFSGEGGLYVPGRWNYVGRKVIYCSESIALFTLEWLANQALSVSGFNYYRYSIDVPPHLVAKYPRSKLPSDWAQTPATDSTRRFAEEHLFSSSHLAIAVPSVMVPEEYHLVINPLHDAFSEAVNSVKILGQYIVPAR